MSRFQKTIASDEEPIIEDELEIVKESDQKSKSSEPVKFVNKKFD